MLAGHGKAWSKHIILHLLRIWIPLVLVLGLVIGLIYRSQVQNIFALAEGDGRQWVALAQRTIENELGQVHSDVLYLADHSELQQWLNTGDARARGQFSSDLLNFAVRRARYDQIRFIDLQGREQIRINLRVDGSAEIVPTTALQNKASRYYVRNALRLKQDEIYVSRLDLNVEHGKIEQPIKPMLRIATPVFDRQGRKRGLIVLNYLGRYLLDPLKTHNGQLLWLVNRQGEWLRGPVPASEWGFMYPGRKSSRFVDSFPEVWPRLQEMPGQLRTDVGLFTFSHVSPLHGIAGISDADWILISHLPAGALDQLIYPVAQRDMAMFIILASLLAILSAVIAWTGDRRRQNEERLHASEISFRGLLDSAPDPIVIVDAMGSIRHVNVQTEKTFGYEGRELIGKPIEILVPERFHRAHVVDRGQYMEEPVTRPMGEGVELYGLRKDGSELPVEISLSPLQTNQGLLVTSIIRDITERKRVEAQKLQAQKRYEELITNLPVGVYRKTPGDTGRYLEVNPAMVSMLEAETAAQLLTGTVSEFYVNPAARAVLSEKILRHGQVFNEEVRLRSLRGREFDAAITAVVKRNERGEVFFDGIVEDISERKHNEQQIRELNEQLQIRATELEALNRELEAFSYSVSHDLRAPLRAMDGFSRTLLNEYADRLDDKGRDRLERIRAAAQRMASLIDDLLKLSRISRAELKREAIDLSQIAAEIMELLQQQEPERQVRLTLSEALETEADARLMRIVMDNLLANAWKFTSQCQDPAIELGLQHDGGLPVYFVRDNGAGFDMAYADKLFGAFQRLHDAREYPGTGIGLATVQRVIHKHGGRIWAESATGKGATFYFTLGQEQTGAVQ